MSDQFQETQSSPVASKGTCTCVEYMYVGKTLKHTKREEENENPGVVVSVNTVFRRQRQKELHVIMSSKPV